MSALARMIAGSARKKRKAVFHRLCGSGGSISTSIGYPGFPAKLGYGSAARKRYACTWVVKRT
jgi:hypothetical protein